MSRSTTYFTGFALLLAIAAAVGYWWMSRLSTSSSTIGPILTENGFIELRPPSTLVSPGAWVQVIKPNPLHLSIVCGASEALGIDVSALTSSDSLTLDLKSKLSPQFEVDADALKSWQASGTTKAVRSLTFSLTNVKLIEISDDHVFKGFKNRTADCKSAIEFRLKQKDAVSMIKSALIADVDYVVSFDGSIDAEAKATASNELALSLGAKIGSASANQTHLVGRQLVWGIRDDAVLASFGSGLPATGGTDEDHSILSGKGPIVQTDVSQQARRIFPEESTFASYSVTPLKQATTMACWATVYTMLKSWKDHKPLPVAAALETLGPEYVGYFVHDLGLPGGGERDFVQAAKLTAEPPANYSLHGFTEMLRSYGPLWITLGDGISSHAMLLIGIYGSVYEETRSAYEAAVFEFVDPMTGAYAYLPALEFMLRFEQEAGVIVTSGANNVELRWQIIHYNASGNAG